MRFIGILVLALTACSAAEQKPEKRWDVKVTKSGEPKVWVAKEDGTKQCEKNSRALTATDAASELKQVGVMVYQGRSGHDGMMRPTVCGASSGRTVELEIGRADLEKALARGYSLKQQN